MKKTLLILLSLVMMAGSLFADNRKQIKRDQLPKAAQHYVMDNWNNVSISYIWQTIDGYTIQYTVRLVDGTMIYFNRDGGWREVKAQKVIPESAIPASIRKFVAQRNKSLRIVGMEKLLDGYIVTLDDESTLKFDLEGNAI